METAAWRARHNPIADADSTLSISRDFPSPSFLRGLVLSVSISVFCFYLSSHPGSPPVRILDTTYIYPVVLSLPPSLLRSPWLMINGADAPASRCAYRIQSPRRIIFVLQTSSVPRPRSREKQWNRPAKRYKRRSAWKANMQFLNFSISPSTLYCHF